MRVVMKKSKGRADPKRVNQLLAERTGRVEGQLELLRKGERGRRHAEVSFRFLAQLDCRPGRSTSRRTRFARRSGSSPDGSSRTVPTSRCGAGSRRCSRTTARVSPDLVQSARSQRLFSVISWKIRCHDSVVGHDDHPAEDPAVGRRAEDRRAQNPVEQCRRSARGRAGSARAPGGCTARRGASRSGSPSSCGRATTCST